MLRGLEIVPGSQWFCDSCNIKVSDVIQSMLRTNGRLDQVIKKQNDCDSALQRAEAHQEMLENKVNVVTKEISQFMEEIKKRPLETELNETMESKEPSWRDIVERQVEAKIYRGDRQSNSSEEKCRRDKENITGGEGPRQ